MKIYFALCALVTGALATNLKNDGIHEIPSVEPEYLDQLLQERRYDEFSYLVGVKNASLVRPRTGQSRIDHTAQTDLPLGDMMLPSERTEEARQGIRFDKYSGNKWQDGVVPYVISNGFSDASKRKIQDTVDHWNSKAQCIHFIPRTNQKDYVMFFSGSGCWSYVGRTGNQQSISIQDPGCVWQGTILHEMQHAIGFMHEQTRSDRDNYIKILWENIPQSWQSQYKKMDENFFQLIEKYDYYSIMHYGVIAPGTNKRAFEVLDKSIDPWKIGAGTTFSQIDLNRISDQYCT